MTGLFQELAKTERPGHVAHQLPWSEVKRLRGRRRLPPGVTVDRGDALPRVGGRVPTLGVVVQHTQNRGHDQALSLGSAELLIHSAAADRPSIMAPRTRGRPIVLTGMLIDVVYGPKEAMTTPTRAH